MIQILWSGGPKSKTGKDIQDPVLCKIAMGVFSIFHGPRVESTFNVMGDVTDMISNQGE